MFKQSSSLAVKAVFPPHKPVQNTALTATQQENIGKSDPCIL
jgi:hypothetical protein